MCGRFILTSPLSVVERLFDLKGPIPDYPARYNIAPSQPIPVVRRRPDSGAVDLALMRWGLIPSWSKGPDSRFSMINARSESLSEKPAFRQAYRQRRGVAPANGYYEWQAPHTGKGRKQPFLIALPDMGVFFLAALWESWRSPAGDMVLSATLVTVAASPDLSAIHDRMPAVLTREAADAWLDPRTPPEILQKLISPPPVSPFMARPVSHRVNNPDYDAPDCIAVSEAAQQSLSNKL